MRFKELFLTFFALALLVISFEAQAEGSKKMPEDCRAEVAKLHKNVNPHHKLLIALENCVRKKEDGPRVIEQAQESGMQQLLFHCFVVNDQNRRLCSQDFVYEREEGVIYFHANYHGAPFPTLVQLVYEALVGY